MEVRKNVEVPALEGDHPPLEGVVGRNGEQTVPCMKENTLIIGLAHTLFNSPDGVNNPMRTLTR